jgi:adenosylhomocysteinase
MLVAGIRGYGDEYTMGDGRRLYPLGESGGSLISRPPAAPGCSHGYALRQPVAVCEWIVRERRDLEPAVYPMPPAIDADVAKLKLQEMGVEIDELTANQR